jgi:hypothetical protein
VFCTPSVVLVLADGEGRRGLASTQWPRRRGRGSRVEGRGSRVEGRGWEARDAVTGVWAAADTSRREKRWSVGINWRETAAGRTAEGIDAVGTTGGFVRLMGMRGKGKEKKRRGEERKTEEEKQGREKGPRKMEIRMALGKPGGAAGHVLFPGRPWAVKSRLCLNNTALQTTAKKSLSICAEDQVSSSGDPSDALPLLQCTCTQDGDALLYQLI